MLIDYGYACLRLRSKGYGLGNKLISRFLYILFELLYRLICFLLGVEYAVESVSAFFLEMLLKILCGEVNRIVFGIGI